MGTALDYLPAEEVYLALSRRRGAYGRVFAPGQTFWLDNSDSQTSDVAGRGSLFSPFKTLAFAVSPCTDRTSGVEGKRVDPGGRRSIKKNNSTGCRVLT